MPVCWTRCRSISPRMTDSVKLLEPTVIVTDSASPCAGRTNKAAENVSNIAVLSRRMFI